MNIKVDAIIDLPVLYISEEYDEELDKATEEAAKIGKVKAESRFAAQHKGVAPDRHAQHVAGQFRAWRGKKEYSEGPSWLFGVAGDSSPEPGTKGGWENTLGARAHFFEYGRAAPGDARGAKVQPPRPFMRSAKATVSRKYNGITAKRLKRLAKKLNTRIK